MSMIAFDSVADRIRQHRQGDQRPIAIVEGVKDERFLKRVLPPGAIAVFIANGREGVIRTVENLSSAGILQIAGMVDRDMDDVVAQVEGSLPLAVYDDADLEAMLWNSDCLEAVMEEFGSQSKLAEIGGIQAFRAKVDAALAPVSRLRRANAVSGWSLDFKGVDLYDKVAVGSLSLSRQGYCDALAGTCPTLDRAQVFAAFDNGQLVKCPVSGAYRHRGRDRLAVTGVGLRRLIGSRSKQAAHPDNLERVLRTAASPNAVASTRWRARVSSLLGV